MGQVTDSTLGRKLRSRLPAEVAKNDSVWGRPGTKQRLAKAALTCVQLGEPCWGESEQLQPEQAGSHVGLHEACQGT